MAYDVVVVGCGIVGLTTAIRLQESGLKVVILSDRKPSETTSYIAPAAVWFPTLVGPRSRVTNWCEDTYRVFEEQEASGVPGVIMRESMMLTKVPNPSLPWWEPIVREFRTTGPEGLPAEYCASFRYTVPLVNVKLYIPWLLTVFVRQGGQIVLGKLSVVDSVKSPLVINCTGLGARSLCGDDEVIPVRGQVVRVSNPGLSMSVRDEENPEGRTYIHPRTEDCILGGTAETNNWSTTVDMHTANKILQRCIALEPKLRDAEVLEHIADLRPWRSSVRCEREKVGTHQVLIHNYGHGGCGVTLSWGCAAEVVKLVVSS